MTKPNRMEVRAGHTVKIRKSPNGFRGSYGTVMGVNDETCEVELSSSDGPLRVGEFSKNDLKLIRFIAMRKVASVVTVILGVTFLLYGLYDFLHWGRSVDLAQEAEMRHLRVMTIVWFLIGMVVTVLGRKLWVPKRG